ncbi:sulfatase-like hydrolase/transferase [Formosa haliotis]|uniref:sulfatase-like hydrolase/transferase n=1 Tax=Formosa haliotis TaxID=1555194 RepID=UPI000AFF6C4B
MPPKKFRDSFKTKTYKIPEFNEAELENLPPQMVKLYNDLNMSRMSYKEKQQAIQDYYAFCAHGDALIGVAVANFKAYCKKNNQEYLIIFTIGDHGWHLGEQGIEAKFGPWKQSTNSAIIVVSSNKEKVPEGKISNQLVEYVDVAPTILAEAQVPIQNKAYNYLDGINLLKTLKTEKEVRDYVIGEINLVAGPRAYLRSNHFAFSMRTRPSNKPYLNENINWALECPVEKAELVLYDLRIDPDETKNVANDPAYKDLAEWFRNKLGKIVLGDKRIECDWSKANLYNMSTIYEGAHDRELNIPKQIIPTIKI